MTRFLILRTFCPTSSKTGLALLNLCINGEVFTLDSISKCIHGHIKADPIQLLEAIDGKLSLKERFLLAQSLEDWWHYQKLMNWLEIEIKTYISKHFPEDFRLLRMIPGISEKSGAVILAKLEPDVNAFKSDAHLASWAGLYPGSYEGAGIKKSLHIRQGNRYIVNWNKIWTNQLGD